MTDEFEVPNFEQIEFIAEDYNDDDVEEDAGKKMPPPSTRSPAVPPVAREPNQTLPEPAANHQTANKSFAFGFRKSSGIDDDDDDYPDSSPGKNINLFPFPPFLQSRLISFSLDWLTALNTMMQHDMRSSYATKESQQEYSCLSSVEIIAKSMQKTKNSNRTTEHNQRYFLPRISPRFSDSAPTPPFTLP